MTRREVLASAVVPFVPVPEDLKELQYRWWDSMMASLKNRRSQTLAQRVRDESARFVAAVERQRMQRAYKDGYAVASVTRGWDISERHFTIG